MGDGINAGVIVKTRFCESNSEAFTGYIEYIDRNEAKRNEMLSEYNLYNDYMDNPEKTTGLFTSGKTKLTNMEKLQLKETFQMSQDNGSLMWQTVISFDNRWLEQYGLYDSESQILDEKKLKEIATGAVNRMLKNEGLENAVWSAAIHYNTDNVHIHIATVEPHPSRAKKEYQVYDIYKVDGKEEKVPVRDINGELVKREGYVGRFKGKSIELCKKHVVDEIMRQQELNLDINRIMREKIIDQKKNHILSIDKDLKDKFLDIYKCLPRVGNRGLWNYNNSTMSRVRPMLDALTTDYLMKYHKEDYEKFIALAKSQSEDYKTAYGKKSKRDFAENKLKELYERLGNKILKEMREYDKKNVTVEYDEKEAERILASYYEQEIEIQEEHIEQDDDFFLDVDNIEVEMLEIKWSANYKAARKLLYGEVKDYKRAFELLNDEVKEGNILALNEIGNIYQRGLGVEIDLEKAREYYYKTLQGFEKIYDKPAETEKEERSKPYVAYRIGKMYYYEQGTDKDVDKAIDYFKASGNIYASYILGNIYYNGDGVDVSKEDAWLYYNAAKGDKNNNPKAKRNPYAYYKTAQMLEKGEVVEKNIEYAQEDYKTAYGLFLEMEKDSPDANTEYKLGMMNLKGKCGDIDLENAEYFLEKSSRNGNIYAQYEYAKLLLKSGDDEKAKEAVKLLKKSADKGNTKSQLALGRLYATDERFYNEKEAIKFLEAAAEKDDMAKYHLSKFYENSKNKSYDMDKAISGYTEIADINSYASYRLGKIYADKEKGYYDVDKAVYYFEKAITQDNEFAQYALAKIYADENSKYYNMEKAMKLFTELADKGNEFAQYKVGNVMFKSAKEISTKIREIENNLADISIVRIVQRQELNITLGKLKEEREDFTKKAIGYLEMAVEQKNIYAQYKLGVIYADKESGCYNTKKAIEYLQPLADDKNIYAQYQLGNVYLDNEYETYNPEQAINYFSMASQQGNEYADIALGFMYYKGEHIQVDMDKARQYFEKASRKGNKTAINMLDVMDNSKVSSIVKTRRRPVMSGYKNKAAYDLQVALYSLKKSFESEMEKERIIRQHEQLLDKEYREKEMRERDTIEH